MLFKDTCTVTVLVTFVNGMAPKINTLNVAIWVGQSEATELEWNKEKKSFNATISAHPSDLSSFFVGVRT